MFNKKEDRAQYQCSELEDKHCLDERGFRVETHETDVFNFARKSTTDSSCVNMPKMKSTMCYEQNGDMRIAREMKANEAWEHKDNASCQEMSNEQCRCP